MICDKCVHMEWPTATRMTSQPQGQIFACKTQRIYYHLMPEMLRNLSKWSCRVFIYSITVWMIIYVVCCVFCTIGKALWLCVSLPWIFNAFYAGSRKENPPDVIMHAVSLNPSYDSVCFERFSCFGWKHVLLMDRGTEIRHLDRFLVLLRGRLRNSTKN
jgi:hypothetical protein